MQDILNSLSAPENRIIIIIIGAVLALIMIILIIRRIARPVTKKVEKRIRKRKYMSREEFMASWKSDREDFPGCYVVLIYDKKLIVNPMNYDDIYIGQSVNVRQRVFSHFKGHGNGDVYYGLKSGCKVFVIIEKCSRKKLNKAEKELIGYFDATSSLNVTRGGSARR